jgi:thioredoxin reductase
MKIFDVIIIGGGPGGLSAALTLGRVFRSCLLFDSKEYRSEGVTAIHMIPSRDGEHPEKFKQLIRKEIIDKYKTIEFSHNKVILVCKVTFTLEDIDFEGFKIVDDKECTYHCKKLILATGSKDILPNIPGYLECWPSKIFQCLFCDGFEESHRPIGVLEFPNEYNMYLALMSFSFTPTTVTVFSNGPLKNSSKVQNIRKLLEASGCKIDDRKIVKLVKHEQVTLHFETGEPVTVAFLIHKPPTIPRAQSLIEQLGLKTEDIKTGGEILTNGMFGETSVKGVFAAGDTATHMKNVSTAISAGVSAAIGANMQLCFEEGKRALIRSKF